MSMQLTDGQGRGTLAPLRSGPGPLLPSRSSWRWVDEASPAGNRAAGVDLCVVGAWSERHRSPGSTHLVEQVLCVVRTVRMRNRTGSARLRPAQRRRDFPSRGSAACDRYADPDWIAAHTTRWTGWLG